MFAADNTHEAFDALLCSAVLLIADVPDRLRAHAALVRLYAETFDDMGKAGATVRFVLAKQADALDLQANRMEPVE